MAYVYTKGEKEWPQYSPRDVEVVKIPSRVSGCNIDGWLFVPDTSPDSQPGLLICSHGITGRKDYGLQVLGADMALYGGFAVLAIDYRGWGGSDGESRNLIDPIRHVEDIVDTFRFCKACMHDRFNVASKLGLFGFSMGASLVICAAAELEAEGAQVGAVVSFAGVWIPNNDPDSSTAKTKFELSILQAAITLDTVQPGTCYYDTTCPLSKIGTPAETHVFLKHHVQDWIIFPPHCDTENGFRVPARSYGLFIGGMKQLMPGAKVENLKAPLLHVHGQYDALSADVSQYELAVGKKYNSKVLAYNGEHFSGLPLMNHEVYEKIKSWMGNDKTRLYNPDIYNHLVKATALEVRAMFQGSYNIKGSGLSRL